MLQQAIASEEDAVETNYDTSEDESGIPPVTVREATISQPTEETTLLLKRFVSSTSRCQNYGSSADLENQGFTTERSWGKFKDTIQNSRETFSRFSRTATKPKSWGQVVKKPVSYIPPVILGLLLNILDALSYGRITSYDGTSIR